MDEKFKNLEKDVNDFEKKSKKLDITLFNKEKTKILDGIAVEMSELTNILDELSKDKDVELSNVKTSDDEFMKIYYEVNNLKKEILDTTDIDKKIKLLSIMEEKANLCKKYLDDKKMEIVYIDE